MYVFHVKLDTSSFCNTLMSIGLGRRRFPPLKERLNFPSLHPPFLPQLQREGRLVDQRWRTTDSCSFSSSPRRHENLNSFLFLFQSIKTRLVSQETKGIKSILRNETYDDHAAIIIVAPCADHKCRGRSWSSVSAAINRTPLGFPNKQVWQKNKSWRNHMQVRSFVFYVLTSSSV